MVYSRWKQWFDSSLYDDGVVLGEMAGVLADFMENDRGEESGFVGGVEVERGFG